MTHEGLHMTCQDHVGGNIIQGDPYSFSPLAWNYLRDRFAVRTVMDIGAGRGHCADYWHRQGCQVLAIDGLESNCYQSHYPVLHWDLTQGAVRCRVDLSICVEVVEHIEEKYLDNLLSSLACGRVILMTNALPGQGGYHHVNEQPTEYWIQHLARYGCGVSEDDTVRVRRLAEQDGAHHIARTGLILINSKEKS